jgi:hypothetical protein
MSTLVILRPPPTLTQICLNRLWSRDSRCLAKSRST